MGLAQMNTTTEQGCVNDDGGNVILLGHCQQAGCFSHHCTSEVRETDGAQLYIPTRTASCLVKLSHELRGRHLALRKLPCSDHALVVLAHVSIVISGEGLGIAIAPDKTALPSRCHTSIPSLLQEHVSAT